tara:strand:- start:585 stop:1121 length:537 start_codon:yes stop_codon:yes gene_type:complete
MKYLETLLEKTAAQRVKLSDGEKVVTKGRTGTHTGGDGRLVGKKGKPNSVAKELLKTHSAGPQGKLPKENSHTVYHDMGMLMAEALGLVSEEEDKKPKGRFDHMKQTPEETARVDRAQRAKARAETAANREASERAKKARGGDNPETTTTTSRPVSQADPNTPGQRAVAKQYGRSPSA